MPGLPGVVITCAGLVKLMTWPEQPFWWTQTQYTHSFGATTAFSCHSEQYPELDGVAH
jgi:hypothetical protein